jgi:nucleoside-diphosphate-sugar epimerase
MRALVTGGGGFLGGGIARRLVENGVEVRTLQRGTYDRLARLGVEQICGDIAETKTVDRAVEDCEVVFHVAARVEMWGAFDPFYRTNVVGTENVLTAMRKGGVSKLVYTSSPSVVHGREDLEGVDESAPYPEHFDAAYPQTKAMAEMAVLAANGPDLATVALRPHLIWGPEDTNLVQQLVERARVGQLRFVGGGQNLVDTVYIDNAVDAHLLAADALAPGSTCAGKAYFISNGDPWPLRKIANGILGAAGLPAENRSISLGVAVAAGKVFEAVHGVFPTGGGPRMTPFIARNLATAHWYDISAARRDLGYEPAVSIEEGLRRLSEWFRAGGGTA